MPEGTLFPWVTFPNGERVLGMVVDLWIWDVVFVAHFHFGFNRKQFRNRKQIRVLNVIALVLIIVGSCVLFSWQKETEYFYPIY
ncbi:MAG: hypothetical protein V8S95_10415 [Odoribacter sp.]